MRIFKDIGDCLHEIPPGFEHLLPDGCAEVSLAEAAQLRAHTLEVRRLIAKVALKAKMGAVRAGGVRVSGNWYHTDGESVSMYTRMRGTNGDLPNMGPWVTMSGDTATMTPALIKSILLAVVAHDAVVRACYTSHVAAVDASEAPENYDFSTGWPAVFTG